MTRTAIFDLDGTLADTSGDLIAAANACFEADGHAPPLDPVAHMAVAFAGGRAMLRKGYQILHGTAQEADVDRHYPGLLAFYGENIDRHTRLYPGVEACLDDLAQAGWRLGVCTNKPEGLAEDLLQRLGLRSRFASMIGADTLPVRKPDAAPLLAAVERAGGQADRSVLIGDTITDRDAARAAGLPCVLVSFGPEGRAVERLQPQALLDHYDALPALLDQLVPAA
ncbi:HAD-IA family hydrolase [Oceanomicrobium pacificus]|uniref:Phosphoglycolate phosphatase n=1 Tax=Oceanomicrobium pacificus TaxID=2692916 RepID=A0A6B0TYM9_9RHOB|nr:HAD-IA family hydrolase [Oceanomicrobium pacificus]MXU66528.1 HAD-IA family hydrolase [Oceanomicrobium pacificus]